jgi:UDP-N-acetylglucosamine--N-acetylmuramyl-(pentapeptide) pyrophosphoryl-undecaprenol N-acetylglucosamine transferase
MIKENKNNYKIFLSGGGTGGSVTPLFQIYRSLKFDFDFYFIGTYKGVERKMVKEEGIRYIPIISGKWRRYFSFLNFLDIFKVFFAFWQSLFLLMKKKPGLIVSAGGFVAVPLSAAAWFLKIPVIIHQQDVVPGLANKIMARFSSLITVTFYKSLNDYKGRPVRLIGNLGPDLSDGSDFSKEYIFDKYKIKDRSIPLILILGGGTGSLFLNNLTASTIDELTSISNVFHISGGSSRDSDREITNTNYFKYIIVSHSDLIDLMRASSLIISRCGLGVLTELSFLKKPSILIPMPNSHQEDNADEFKKQKAAIILHQENFSKDVFLQEVRSVLSNKDLSDSLSKNVSRVIKNGNQEMIAIIKGFFK